MLDFQFFSPLHIIGVLLILFPAVAKSQTDHPIKVNNSGKCTSPKVLHGNMAAGDTVTWSIATGQSGSGVTNFHIVFVDSPFGDQKYFDKDHNQGTVAAQTSGETEAYKYVIAVDGGKACDPHVIIVPVRGGIKGGKGKETGKDKAEDKNIDEREIKP